MNGSIKEKPCDLGTCNVSNAKTSSIVAKRNNEMDVALNDNDDAVFAAKIVAIGVVIVAVMILYRRFR